VPLCRGYLGLVSVLCCTAIAACQRAHQPAGREFSSHDLVEDSTKAPNAHQESQARCAPLWPTRLILYGVVEESHRLGPPGYGETPEIDEKLTIFLLQLDQPIDVCADTTGGQAGVGVRDVRTLQLTGRLDQGVIKQHLDEPLSVFGTLSPKEWGTDFTDIILHVDSIPALRPQQAGSTRVSVS
jgi:hypothetical protein